MATETNDSATSSRTPRRGCENVSINIEDLELQKNIEDLEPKPECCIYGVPIDLRKINEKAYTPQVISIGPLHHGNIEFINMEKQKLRYKRIFIKENREEIWKEMRCHIRKKEQRIRNCYEELSTLPKGDKFIDMILDDAVFIIELFCRNYWGVFNDFLLEKPRYRNTIKRGLQLLENQLPYFVLEDLYMLAFNKVGIYNHACSGSPSFSQIACKFFDYDANMMDRFPRSVVVKHFTDLKRYSLIEKHPTANEQNKLEGLPCATKLQESGIRFKSVEDGCLLDLKFDTRRRGILPFFKVYELKIPNFKVNDWTEVLIRNVMALEQCHYPKETYVCNYISLMDFLINTEKDADLLIGKGVITNCLGEDAAIAKMFNKFCLQTSSPSSCYYDMAKKLKEHYKSPSHHAKATLKSVYFSNPWKSTGTVVAFIVLVLTFGQTAFSILRLLKA